MYSLTRILIGAPARHDAERHQRGGEDHERQRDAVDAHVVGAEAAEPGLLLDELEFRRARIEAPHQDQRHREGDERGPERDPARIARAGLVVLQQHQMKSTPTSGRKVVTERMGQLAISALRRPRT